MAPATGGCDEKGKEMNGAGGDLYDRYFSFRNVDAACYDRYVIPAYLRGALPPERDAAILDIGCGLGQFLKALRREGYSGARGVDLSAEAVSHCQGEGLSVSRVDDLCAFCREAGERFDFIVMSHVIEHLEKSQIVETLAAIRQHLLKEGGALMVMTPNAQSLTGCYWAYEDFTHTTIFTAGSLYFVLKSAGFREVVFVDPLGTVGSSAPGRALKHLLIAAHRWRLAFWHFVTDSSFHKGSPQIFTFELKALAR